MPANAYRQYDFIRVVCGRPAGLTVADPTPQFVVRAGLHGLNQTYSHVSCAWNDVNISVEATVDVADNSQLSLVISTNTVSNSEVLTCMSFWGIARVTR